MKTKENSLFTESVKKIVSEIPKGKVMTYKEVAIKAKNPKAARAVANIMAKNFDPKVPCHRVIRDSAVPTPRARARRSVLAFALV